MPDLSAFSLAGKIAVVTGASRGIGAAIASGLKDAGATVFGLSRSGTAPQGVTAIACDLSDDAAIGRAFNAIAAQGGRIDALVNAAGISLPPQSSESELARFRATVATDLTGVYATILAAYPLLKTTGSAAIINVTSINSIRGFPGNLGYVAAKAGLAGLTRALAAETGEENLCLAGGVALNCVANGKILRDGRFRNIVMLAFLRERRRFVDFTPNDVAGNDHDDARQERDAPAP